MVVLAGLLPQLISRLAGRANAALRAPRYSSCCCAGLCRLTVDLSPSSATLVVVPCRRYSRRSGRSSGRRMNAALMSGDRWRMQDASLAARRRVVLLLMVQSYCRHDAAAVPLVSFDVDRARAGCLVCIALVGIGLASAVAYRLCCRYLLPPPGLRGAAGGDGEEEEEEEEEEEDSGDDSGDKAKRREMCSDAHSVLRNLKLPAASLTELLLPGSGAAVARGNAPSGKAQVEREATATRAAVNGESSPTERLSASGACVDRHSGRILCFASDLDEAAPTPSDPLSFSDEFGDGEADGDAEDDATVAEELRARLQELRAGWQPEEPRRPAPDDREDSDSCASSQLGSLRQGVSLFSDCAASSAATTGSVVMDDSGVDFLCEAGGEASAPDHTLTKLDRLMERLQHVQAEAGGMCRSCESLQTFADNLHNGVAEFDRSLQQAQLLCEEVSASERQPASRISQSSSFGLDCDPAANWSTYDEAVQERIAEILSDAGLEEILADDADADARLPEANIGPLVSVLEFASSEWAGATQRAERIRRGYARLVADGSASFVRRVRDDQYCALRATLFSFFLHVAELPQPCSHWLERAEHAFAANPWLSEWQLPPLLAAGGCEAPASTTEAQLAACVRRLYAALAAVRARPGSLHREWQVLQLFNGQAGDAELLEATKLLLVLRAAELHSACECGRAPVHAHLLFSRASSSTLRDLFRNHIAPVGASAGLGQPELLLLSDLLRAGIRLYRPFAYGEDDDFVLLLGDSRWPQLQLVSEYDTRYHVLLA